MNFSYFAGGSLISLEFTETGGVTLPPPPASPTPPPGSIAAHNTSLSNITVAWGAEDVKMIQMELAPHHTGPHGQMGAMISPHDPAYSPHNESMGSEGHHDSSSDQDGMQNDSKRKRK